MPFSNLQSKDITYNEQVTVYLTLQNINYKQLNINQLQNFSEATGWFKNREKKT